MKITEYGNASIRVDTEDQSFFFDTYNKDLVKAEETAQQRGIRETAFAEAKRVFITHGHFDHLGSITALYRNRETQIYCSETPAKTLRRQGFPAERLRLVRPGEIFTFEGVSILAYHTKHCRFNGGEIINVLFRRRLAVKLGELFRFIRFSITYPAAGECLLYEIFSEGKRIQLLGSAGLDPDVDYQTGADVLILPYQGRSDMAFHCMKIVDRLQPRRIFLDHYDNSFPPMTCMEDTAPFVELMRQKYPEIECVVLKEDEPVEL